MRDWRPRIIDVLRKPQKCPVCGERVVDIIYGTGDMTELEFLLEYRQDGIMGGDNIPGRPPIWACGCRRFRKVNADGTDAPVKPKLLKNVRKKPMTLIIYYIGAGASYGIRKNDEIIEGIPVVKEIPSEFDAFKRFIEKAEVPEGDIVFQDMCRTGHDDVENEKRYMLHDINSLIQGIKDHATIDTYARKLYLTKRYRDLERLKSLLCAFFLWEQLEHRPDGRYDTFLANVLDNQTLNIPEEISIISWNYDSQIELAFSSYNQNAGLAVFEKNIVGKWPTLAKTGRVFKVNGSATYVNGEIVSLIKNYDKTSVAIQIIQFYSNSMADTTDMGFQFKTHLSFAWEDSPNNENMMQSLRETTKDTELVVVIGYSFPFFNRETDREIFKGMPKLKKVYVQDVNSDAVIQSLRAVLPIERKIDVVPEKNCEQFFLPAEL